MANQKSLTVSATVVAIEPGSTESLATVELRDPFDSSQVAVLALKLSTEVAQNLGVYAPGSAEAAFTLGSSGTTEPQGVLASSLPAHTAGNITTNPFPASGAFQVAPQFVGSGAGSLLAKYYFRHSGSDTHIADATVSATGVIGPVNLSTNGSGSSGDSIVIKLIDVATNEIGADSVLPS